MTLGYEIILQPLYERGLLRNQDKVDCARLVFPSGAVSNAGLLWIEVGVNGREDRQLLAVPVVSFHDYVKLPMVLTGGHEELKQGKLL